MIARVWHGCTAPEHADANEAMLKPELLPGINRVSGYRGSYAAATCRCRDPVHHRHALGLDRSDPRVAGADYEAAEIPEGRWPVPGLGLGFGAGHPRPLIPTLRCQLVPYNLRRASEET